MESDLIITQVEQHYGEALALASSYQNSRPIDIPHCIEVVLKLLFPFEPGLILYLNHRMSSLFKLDIPRP